MIYKHKSTFVHINKYISKNLVKYVLIFWNFFLNCHFLNLKFLSPFYITFSVHTDTNKYCSAFNIVFVTKYLKNDIFDKPSK